MRNVLAMTSRQQPPPAARGTGTRGFTLTELLVAAVVVAVIAGLALPSYRKTLENGHEDDAIVQLKTIHSANAVYNARARSYWPPDGSAYNAAAINGNLKINLIEEGVTFSCTGTDGSSFTCTATRAGNNGYTVQVTEADLSGNNVNPCSTRGGVTCP